MKKILPLLLLATLLLSCCLTACNQFNKNEETTPATATTDENPLSVIPPCTFVAKVVEVYEKQLFVTVTNSGWSSLKEGTPAYVSIPQNNSETFVVGDYVIVDFDSMVQEIYPPIVPNVYTITKCDSNGNLLQ